MLEAAGYETTVVSAGFDHLPLRDVEHYLEVGPRTELEASIWEAAAVGRFLDGLTDGFVADTRTRTLREFEVLHDAVHAHTSRPQFVLAHLPVPHYPMAFRADCSLRPGDQYTFGTIARGSRAGDANAVKITADQTRCVDALLADAMRDLVATRPDAVVLVFSDHGPEELIDWTAPDDAGIQDRMANLFWARTPSQPGLFPDDISLVNVLPVLANAYLGTDLPLHQNDLYFGSGPDGSLMNPYRPSPEQSTGAP